MRKLLAGLAGFALSAGLVAAVAPAASAGENRGRVSSAPVTIAGAVAASGGEFDSNGADYDMLLNAVKAANLVGVLDAADANLTVFAPNDRAFVRLANSLGYAGHDEAGAFDAIVAALTQLGGGDPIPVLTNVLLYHVSPGRTDVRTLVRSQGDVATALGTSFHVRGVQLVDADPEIRNPRLSITIRVSNGNILPIDRVLLPVNV